MTFEYSFMIFICQLLFLGKLKNFDVYKICILTPLPKVKVLYLFKKLLELGKITIIKLKRN